MTTSPLSTILEFPILSRIRRNHGLEHATIHILSKQKPGRSLAGHSDAGGFWLWGDVRTEDVENAAQEALTRMRNGEHQLAVHPNCGTNFATAGLAAGVAGAIAMFGAGPRIRHKLERLPLAGLLATIALIFAQPLGFAIQQNVTTSGHPGNLEVVSVSASQRGRLIGHRVTTRG
ncbi:MAG: hypothetical protein DWQ07_24840 [Chloroflexi bacterium]|nr:MAG: hypothetical protein DWQ07_24840 [Chloroflexota bacterium]MBL1197080.1 hypothetical protein [Chloroflexota bacterium]NOH14375.1 hypothetical protein [Chloroflexota bacterium]